MAKASLSSQGLADNLTNVILWKILLFHAPKNQYADVMNAILTAYPPAGPANRQGRAIRSTCLEGYWHEKLSPVTILQPITSDTATEPGLPSIISYPSLSSPPPTANCDYHQPFPLGRGRRHNDSKIRIFDHDESWALPGPEGL